MFEVLPGVPPGRRFEAEVGFVFPPIGASKAENALSGGAWVGGGCQTPGSPVTAGVSASAKVYIMRPIGTWLLSEVHRTADQRTASPRQANTLPNRCTGVPAVVHSCGTNTMSLGAGGIRTVPAPQAWQFVRTVCAHQQTMTALFAIGGVGVTYHATNANRHVVFPYRNFVTRSRYGELFYRDVVGMVSYLP